MHFRFKSTPVFSYLLEGNAEVCDRLMTIADPKAGNDVEAKLRLWDGLIHFFENRPLELGSLNNRLPSGLLPRLRQRLEKRGHTVEVTYSPPLLALQPIPADFLIGVSMDGDRSYQLDAVNAGLEQGRGLWWLATNAGKSYCIAAFVGALKRQANLKTLVVVPNKTLVHQTSQDIAKLLGPDVRVGMAGDGVKNTKCDVLVGTFQTLNQGVPKSGREFSEDLYSFIVNCGGIVVDETHHASSTTITAILQLAAKAQFRIGCTGTVDKTDKSLERADAKNAKAIEHRWRIESFLGPVIARVTNEDLIEKGISAKPTIYVVEDRQAFGDTVFPPPPTFDAEGNAVRDPLAYQRMFTDAAINDKRFRRSVAVVASAYLAQDKPPFIFSHSVVQLTRLKKTFDHFNIPCELLSGKDGTYRRDAVLRKFREQGNFAILTSPIFDEGVSVPEIRGIIFAGARKVPVELLQRIGRALRKKKEGENCVSVTDFAMLHCKLLNQHYKSRLASFLDEGFEVHRVGDVNSFSQITL